MRILHVPYSFFPDPPGGTEIYVDSLVTSQKSLGLEVGVAAPGAESVKYERAGTPVWRLPTSPNLELRELYGEGDARVADAFGATLDEFRPNVVHLHAMTSGVSVRLAGEAAARRIPIVFNYHTPTVSCARGTLLRWGSEICDGKLHAKTCGECSLMARGVSRPVAQLVRMLGPLVGNSDRSGGIWTALRIPELTVLRMEMFRRMMRTADRVVALCHWTRELLLLNGVPEAKLSMCRQGINWEPWRGISPERAGNLKLAFFGRLDATKGADLAVRALLRSELPIQLDLYGVRQGDAGNRYAEELHGLIGTDPRVRLLQPVAAAEVIPTLRGYDAIVVPSQWLETGPLVVLEAFAANTPVIGSDLGGIAELVRDGKDGLLVSPYDSVDAWAAAFARMSRDVLDSLRAGIRPPRHTRQVAEEFVPLYEELVRR